MSYPYYRFFPGDYARDTRDLTMIQHGAYRLLLDHYYSTGKPLPDDHEALCRIAGAKTRHERAAVLLVTTRFFTVDTGLRYQKRVATELGKLSLKSTQAADSAKKRWSERNANAHANAMPRQCKPDLDLEPEPDLNQVLLTPIIGAPAKPTPIFEKEKGNGKTKIYTEPWDRTEAGIERMGKQTGIDARPGESYDQWAARIRYTMAVNNR